MVSVIIIADNTNGSYLSSINIVFACGVRQDHFCNLVVVVAVNGYTCDVSLPREEKKLANSL